MTSKNNSLDKFMRAWSATSRFHVPLWILLHAGIVMLALAARPIAVNSDLYSILPSTSDVREVSDAEKKMSASTNAGMFILVANKDFPAAKRAAEELVDAVASHPDVESVSFKIDAGAYAQVRDFLFKYRYQIQDPATIAALKDGEAGRIAEDALATVYSPFSLTSLGNLGEDPFLLTESSVRSYLDAALKSGMAVSPKDDVLTAEKDGVHYVLVSLRSKAGGTSLDTEKSLVPAIYAAEGKIRAANADVSFSNSGVPFHSYESASKAQREITIITIASLLLSILILIFVFRSIVPLIATVAAIAVGAGSAFAVTLLAFGEVHVFTLAFGTSLIGVSIDYALHFFTESRKGDDARDGKSILRNVLSGVMLGLITTLISYAVLLIAPFGLLRQMALFSIAGLISMFCTVVLVFPRVIARFGEKKPLPVGLGSACLKAVARLGSLSKKQRLAAFAIVAIAFIPGLFKLKFDNDIRGLYTMSPSLLESEKTVARVLDYGSAGWYFIVSGTTEEDLLQREESLAARLSPVVGTERLGSYMAISRFLPSLDKQRKTADLVRKNLLPLADGQLAALGFDAAQAKKYREGFETDAARLLTPADYFEQPISKMTGSFWIGAVDGKFYSAVFPLHAKDPAFFSDLAKSMPGVYFVNKTADISSTLKDISFQRLILLVVAYAAMILFLSFRYGPVLSLKISRAPLAAGILTCATLGYLGMPLNLFSVMGLVLIIGIGVDYSIFLTEAGEKKESTMLAVIICMLTTVFSFGTLSLSSLRPVATFGITALTGILFSFVLAPINTAHIRERHTRTKK